MFKLRSAAVALGALIAASSVAVSAGLFPGFPIVGGASYCTSSTNAGTGTTTTCNSTAPAGPATLTGTELIPADTGLASGQQPQTVVIPSSLIGSLNVKVNRLIGGDFATNLWQRGTTPLSAATPSTTTMAADRWAAYSSGNTVTITKQTGASDTIPTIGLYGSMRVSRPSTTNTSQICVGQVLDKQAAADLIGKTGVLSFWALAGAGLAAVDANNTLAVTIAYYTAADSATPGTNTDSFMKGTTTGYTAVVTGGSVGTTATVASGIASVPTSTTWTRYAVYGAIPTVNASGTAVTGAGVTICYTPASGTGGSTEWFEIEGVQLQATPTGVNAPTAFEQRAPAIETALQQYYTWVLQETSGAVYPGGVLCTSTGNAWIALAPPVALRETPTVVVAAGGLSIRTAAAVTAIGTTTLISGSTAQTLSLTSGAACTATLPYQLVGTNTTGSFIFSAEP